MPIENPLPLFGRTTPSPAEERTLKNSASGNFTLTSKPAMDMVSVQRPDKASPCPRCQSLDTKFCYFNNYNAKQPRHFCRKCQRYWTAGGSLRNVPVGAGRRKHKTLSSSTAPKSHLEDDDAHFDQASHITSGMCYPSSETIDFIPESHGGGAWPHSFQRVAAMSMRAHDSHSEMNVGNGIRHAAVHKSPTESDYFPSYLCHDAQSNLQQKDDVSFSSQHDVDQLNGALRLWPKGAQHVQHKDEALPVEVYSDEKVGEHAPPPSSSSHRSPKEKMEVEASMSTSKAFDEKVEGTPQSVWIEQVAKAMEGKIPAPKSMALHGAYGYGHASLPWSHPWMWPWLWPCVNNNAQANSNIDQAAVSAAWANAITATAASFMQISSMWNPHGWGSAPVNLNNSEGLSTLGKRPRSPSHEQEPLCVPKTLKIGHPEEVVHSSILMTLGLSLPASSPASVTGFFTADSQPKVDVFQCKSTEQVPQHRQPQRLHLNPAAQARSLAFQESS